MPCNKWQTHTHDFQSHGLVSNNIVLFVLDFTKINMVCHVQQDPAVSGLESQKTFKSRAKVHFTYGFASLFYFFHDEKWDSASRSTRFLYFYHRCSTFHTFSVDHWTKMQNSRVVLGGMKLHYNK